MAKSRASKMNGYRSMVSRQKNDVFKFKPKKKRKGYMNKEIMPDCGIMCYLSLN